MILRFFGRKALRTTRARAKLLQLVLLLPTLLLLYAALEYVMTLLLCIAVATC
jgi:hypothetical protein